MNVLSNYARIKKQVAGSLGFIMSKEKQAVFLLHKNPGLLLHPVGRIRKKHDYGK
jgi:hypothetical protein